MASQVSQNNPAESRLLREKKGEREKHVEIFRLREKSRPVLTSIQSTFRRVVHEFTDSLTHATFDPGPVWKPSPRRDYPGVYLPPGRVFLVATHGRSTRLSSPSTQWHPVTRWMLAHSHVFLTYKAESTSTNEHRTVNTNVWTFAFMFVKSFLFFSVAANIGIRPDSLYVVIWDTCTIRVKN